MGRNRSMTPGGTGFTYGANTHGNQGGGNKKQGLPPTGGRPGWLSNFIRTRAGGYFRGIPAATDPCHTKEVIGVQRVVTQAQANLLRGVTKITGSLFLRGLDNDITDLSPFDCLKEVTKSIVFGGDDEGEELNLETISGFNNLVKVGGMILFGGNAALKTISGFRNLINIGKHTEADDFNGAGLVVVANSVLVTISGFDSLTSIEGYVYIENNVALETISGFGSLTSIGGACVIINNAALETISGFRNLITVGKSVGGSFDGIGVLVGQNPELKEISGFGNLKTVEGDFALFMTPLLTNASGLGNVESVGGGLVCDDTKLNKKGFADLVTSLTTIGGNIFVSDNNGDDFDVPGKLGFWGAAGSKVVNTRTLNGKKATEAQLDTNSFGGIGVPQATTDLFALPDNPLL